MRWGSFEGRGCQVSKVITRIAVCASVLGILSFAGLAVAQGRQVAEVSLETMANASLASLPIAPSLAFFLGGMAGLLFLVRRKRRKPSVSTF